MSDLAFKFYFTFPLIIVVSALALFLLHSLLLDWHQRKSTRQTHGGGGLDRRNEGRFLSPFSNTARYAGTAFALAALATGVWQYNSYLRERDHLANLPEYKSTPLNTPFDLSGLDPYAAFYSPAALEIEAAAIDLRMKKINEFYKLTEGEDITPSIFRDDFRFLTLDEALAKLRKSHALDSAAKDDQQTPQL